MADKQKPARRRMKDLPLWQWGLICIASGGFVGALNTSKILYGTMSRSERRAAEIGNASAIGLFLIVGIVLIVMHFVRGKKK
jgi:hypothetical protein